MIIILMATEHITPGTSSTIIMAASMMKTMFHGRIAVALKASLPFACVHDSRARIKIDLINIIRLKLDLIEPSASG